MKRAIRAIAEGGRVTNFDRLWETFVNLLLTIAHELKLDALVEWLTDRLKVEEKKI